MSETRTDRWYLSSAPIVSALLHLCVPMAAAMIVGAVYNVLNSGFIGSLHDTALLAAVTLGAPILGLVMAIGNVFGVGAGTLVSRLLGSEEFSEIKHVSAFAVWGSVLVGVLAGGLGLVFLDPLVSLLGADSAAFAATREFAGVLFAFVPVLAVAMCLEQLVRAGGAARTVMTGLIASTVANVVFDVMFILVFGWGVAGAALATGLANVVTIVWFVRWLVLHGEHISLLPRWFTVRGSVVRPVLGVGVGELLQASFLVVTSLVLNNLAAAYGDGPLAAMGVAVRIAQVPEFLIVGITLGVLPLLAYSYGRGDRARLSAALRGSAVAVGGIGLVFAVSAIVFRDALFSTFVADPSVLTVGATILTAQLVAMVANGFTGLLTSLFQAVGRALPATVMSLAQGVLFIPVVILGNLWFGLGGIIWALTVTEIFVLVVGFGLWVGFRGSIARGLSGGSVERAEAVREG